MLQNLLNIIKLVNHPEARTVLTPCFRSCMMDICYGFKGQTFKRSQTVIKIYGLVIVCLLTGATHIMALKALKLKISVQTWNVILTDMESLDLFMLRTEPSLRHCSMQNFL